MLYLKLTPGHGDVPSFLKVKTPQIVAAGNYLSLEEKISLTYPVSTR